MSKSLEQWLEPGEQLLYYARKRWLCANSLDYLALNLLCVAVMAVAGVVAADLASLVALGSVFFSLAGFMTSSLLRRIPSEAIVTDRRAVQISGLFKKHIKEIPLPAVKHVKAGEDVLQVTQRDDKIFEIPHPSDSCALAVAITRAAGVPPPNLPTPPARWIDFVWLACVVAIAMMVGGLALKVLFIFFGVAIFSFSIILGIGIFAVGGLLAQLAGVLIGGPLSLVLLRPFVGYETLRRWIDTAVIFWTVLDDGPGDTTLRDLHLWTADRLYRTAAPATER